MTLYSGPLLLAALSNIEKDQTKLFQNAQNSALSQTASLISSELNLFQTFLKYQMQFDLFSILLFFLFWAATWRENASNVQIGNAEEKAAISKILKNISACASTNLKNKCSWFSLCWIWNSLKRKTIPNSLNIPNFLLPRGKKNLMQNFKGKNFLEFLYWIHLFILFLVKSEVNGIVS